METEIPLVAETIALTEKKVDMALDDIIKLSKRNTNVNKGKKPRREKNKKRNSNGAAKNYMNSLSAVRQGAVAKRGNQFPVTTNIARKASTAPPLNVRGRAINAGRMTSANHSRRVAPSVGNRSVHGRLIVKRHEVVVENGRGKRKTLDSRFATIKEQRKAHNKSNNYGVRVQVPRLPPWAARATRFPY